MTQPTSNTPLLDVKSLAIQFGEGANAVKAVESISFSLNKGETLALVGESGSGKSVTALSLMRLLPYPKAKHPSGEIRFDGQDVLALSEGELQTIRGDKISMIFQEPMTSLNPLHTIEKQIGESLDLHTQLKGSAARQRILELLTLVGIRDPETRLKSYPHQLSGGQRQRVMIAMALANEPELLIADEPTTALDVTVQKQILELLQSLQQKLGMAILLITHDLNIVKHYAHRVCVMYQGKQIETGSVSQVFQYPQESYTKTLLNADPTGTPILPCESPCTLLRTERLNVWFPTKKSILGKPKAFFKAVKNVDLTLKKGGTLGIVGESGSGKTTLGMAILRLINSDGEIEFAGQRIDALNQREMKPLRRHLQVVFQDPYGSLSPRMTVGECIAEGLGVHNIEPPEKHQQLIAQALTDVGLSPDVQHRYPHEFSGGQRQRIAIARALILRPELIILDEPTSALDRTVQAQIVDLLRDLQAKFGITYLFISHDLTVIKAMSHKVMVMNQGEVIEMGSTEQIFSAPKTDYTKTLLEAALG
jgi:microcin C transport system ATP-binding protein